MSEKKMMTARDMIAERAMDILKPLYKGAEYFWGDGKDDGVPSFTEPDNIMRKELLEKMTKEAAGLFIKGDGLYSGALFTVANDYAEGVSSGLVPGLCYKEDVAKFYDRHEDAIIDAVDRICIEKNSRFGDMAGFDASMAFLMDADRVALTKFVVDHELSKLRTDIQRFRDELEKIPRLRAVKQEPEQKASLRLGKTASPDHDIAM